jgi:hypothetical protein
MIAITDNNSIKVKPFLPVWRDTDGVLDEYTGLMAALFAPLAK